MRKYFLIAVMFSMVALVHADDFKLQIRVIGTNGAISTTWAAPVGWEVKRSTTNDDVYVVMRIDVDGSRLVTNRFHGAEAVAWPVSGTDSPLHSLKTNANGSMNILAFDDVALEFTDPVGFIVPPTFDSSKDMRFHSHGYGAVTGTVANLYRYRLNGLRAWTTLTGLTYVAAGTFTNLTFHIDPFDINPSAGDWFEFIWARQTTNIAGNIAGDWNGVSLYLEWFEK